MPSCKGGCTRPPSCCSTKCSGAARKTGRYKTLENFLRRMAFNLGNTVSQTDVKIVSCIPIDVTDLQQRIIDLEKELANAKGNDDRKKNKNEENGNKKDADDEEKKDEETKEGKDSKTKVMRMQLKNPIVEIKKNTGLLSEGPDYLKDFLNIDSTNEAQSLYKAAKKHETQNETKLKYTHSTTNSDFFSSHHSIHKMKSGKSNPFTVVMGNIKKRKNIDVTKYDLKMRSQNTNQFENSGSSYSFVMPHTQKRLFKASPDRKIEDSFRVDSLTNSKPKRKIKKKNDKVFPSFFPRNQYVYYAQTNSPYKPGFSNNNYDCDITYIANLIEKQYTPVHFNNGRKGLNRQFSVPVCRDNVDILGSKYAISGNGPCLCCPATSSDYNMRNDVTSQEKYQEYIQTNINGRFNDTTMYDIIPVKQNATKKLLDPISCEKNPQRTKTRRSHPPLKSFLDIDPPLNLHPTRSLETMYDTGHSKCSERNISLANNIHRKNKYSRTYSKPKPGKEQKTTLEPEDIYMTKKLRPAETSSRANLLDTCSDDLKQTQSKPNEAVAELKTILHDFLKEIKEDMPKICEPLNTNNKDAHNAQVSQQTPFAFVPNFPNILQPPQCCCPVLYPLNFIPDAYKVPPAGLCSYPRNLSQCCIHNNVTKNEKDFDSPKQGDLVETKRLIEEIYNSMSLQNEAKAENNNCDITYSKNASKENTKNENENKNECTNEMQCKVHMKNQCIQSEVRIFSEESSETISKSLTRHSETSPSSMNTESSIPNVQEKPRKNTKKGKFSNMMKIIKSVSFKKQAVAASECEINSQFYEKPPFEQNITQCRAKCQREREGKFKKMYANHTANTDNRPEDIYNCCYFDKGAERMPGCAQPATSRSQWSPKCRGRHDAPPHHNSPHMYDGSYFCMQQPQQIPFCLKEIEVKNAGTQSIKRKKMFAIFKKLKGGSDTESVPSHENYQPRRLPQNFIMHERDTERPRKKSGFWQFLKGEKDFDPDAINDYNFIDTGKGSHGMKRAPPAYFNNKMVNRNPLSFKNVFMRTLIGQKPVANTKAARAFF